MSSTTDEEAPFVLIYQLSDPKVAIIQFVINIDTWAVAVKHFTVLVSSLA